MFKLPSIVIQEHTIDYKFQLLKELHQLHYCPACQYALVAKYKAYSGRSGNDIVCPNLRCPITLKLWDPGHYNRNPITLKTKAFMVGINHDSIFIIDNDFSCEPAKDIILSGPLKGDSIYISDLYSSYTLDRKINLLLAFQ